MVSRVAKSPVNVPSGVEVTFASGELKVKGKNGHLVQKIHKLVKLDYKENIIQIMPANSSTESNALAGTIRALVNNMIIGVTDGFEKKLEMIGVGYRAKAAGKSLNISAGFSHPVDIQMPDGVTVETPSNTEIVLKGPDKQKVAQIAANIRAVRPPEPYKGKGIRYSGEHVVRKEGKKK